MAYLLAVAVIDVLRSDGEGPVVRALASSPSGVASGHVGRLVTSGLVIAGDPGARVLGPLVVAVAALVLLGPSIFWWAAFVGHVLATLVAYAGIGVLWLVDRSAVAAVVDAPDYGISCVVAGSFGVLLAAVVRRRPRVQIGGAIAACAAVAVVAPFGDGLARAEHALAIVLGTLIGLVLERRDPWAGGLLARRLAPHIEATVSEAPGQARGAAVPHG